MNFFKSPFRKGGKGGFDFHWNLCPLESLDPLQWVGATLVAPKKRRLKPAATKIGSIYK